MKAERFDAEAPISPAHPRVCNECRQPLVHGEHIVRGKMYGSRWVKHLRCFDANGSAP